jgi:hypothetical protein
MSHIYSVAVKIDITTAGGDVDLFSFVPADDKPITLRGFRLSQPTELGEIQEEGLEITIRRFGTAVTIGSGGSAVTAQAPPEESADPVWGFSARTNDTTVATTTGTNFLYDILAWNVRNSPYEIWYPDKKFCLKAKQTEAIIIRNETVIADTITLCLTAWVEEE